MRIALCLEYPIDQHGGTEVLVSRLIDGLSRRHEVILVSPDTPESLARSQVAAGVRQHIPFRPVWDSVGTARALAGKIAAAAPDVVHFHFGGSYGWGNRSFWKCPIFYLSKNIPCLSTNHGAFSILEGYCWDRRSLAVKLALLPPAWLSKQIIIGRLATEVAVSQYDHRALRRWYPLVKKKFRWIYHSRLAVDTVPENIPMAQRQNVVLCVGTIGSRKAQPTLIEAFARVADKCAGWRLVLVGRNGDAAVMTRVDQAITQNRLQGRVQYLGALADAQVETHVRNAAIFAMPSTYEGLGLSLQEAQFYGCACVATRCGGTADLIEDGENGLLVPVGDVDRLADALGKLMTDEPLRECFGRRAPQSVLDKNMTAGKMVQAYENLYTEMTINRMTRHVGQD